MTVGVIGLGKVGEGISKNLAEDGHDVVVERFDGVLDGADVVAWHVFGLHHLPRLEDAGVVEYDATSNRVDPVRNSAAVSP